jgi:hypothetical protein
VPFLYGTYKEKKEKEEGFQAGSWANIGLNSFQGEEADKLPLPCDPGSVTLPKLPNCP